jgi:hypothetical protein
VELAVPLFLSGTGVAVAAVAYYNRYNPSWQRDMRRVYIVAFGQVALGAVTWLLPPPACRRPLTDAVEGFTSGI